jgi:hypothetical protein
MKHLLETRVSSDCEGKMGITYLSDEELLRIVKAEGPSSPAADILRRLTKKRRKDYQVHVWTIGQYYFIGPMPDAKTELAMLEFALEDDERD